jgi:hypothetical protein
MRARRPAGSRVLGFERRARRSERAARPRVEHGHDPECAGVIALALAPALARLSPRRSGRKCRFRRQLLLLIGAALVVNPVVAIAQEPGPWNAARALDLMSRARQRRAEPVADSLLRNYRAVAEGMVYFYLDRREGEERTLVKSDQIALEVYWGTPDLTKQRIVGMRGENALPNRMYYHLDHLTVVQNEFGDQIRLGDGDEVRDVPHPAAPGSDSIYDFRIADSLTIRLPGAAEPVKAYQIDVRPKRTDQSAFVGSVFVDRATADLVRMTFTFTPASYVDRRLDYINISLDNSLWNGRYWLPYEQAVEIRRQLPELDFVAGSVIQGRFRITDYEFNLDLPPDFFSGYPVVAVPREERENFAFDRALYEDLMETGLAPPPHMRAVRAQAAALLRARVLSGLPRLRASLPNASSALRYNRAEGLFLGLGVSYVADPRVRSELTGGYAFGDERGHLGVDVRLDHAGGTRVRAAAILHELRDIGIRPGMPGVLNTISSFSLGDDFLDPYYATGVRVGLERPVLASWTLGVQLATEHHESLRRVAETVLFDDVTSFRSVRPVDEGVLVSAHTRLAHPLTEASPTAWGGSVALEAGWFDGDLFARPTAEAVARRRSTDLRTTARLRVATGLALGSPASQHLFLLGGRETLPGYDYRSFSGDAFVLTDFEATRTVAAPWIGVRLLGAAGWTGWLDDPPGDPASSRPGQPAWTTWNAHETRGIRTSVGAGTSLFYDLLRIDLVRGLNRGGAWQLQASLNPSLWGVL